MSEWPDIEALARAAKDSAHGVGCRCVSCLATDTLLRVAREERDWAERIQAERVDALIQFYRAMTRAESAEARLRVATEALGRLDGMRGAGFSSPEQFARHVRGIARAALAKLREEEKSDTKESR